MFRDNNNIHLLGLELLINRGYCLAPNWTIFCKIQYICFWVVVTLKQHWFSPNPMFHVLNLHLSFHPFWPDIFSMGDAWRPSKDLA